MASPGKRLGPYEVLGQLGAGGMGEVYLALDNRLNREVALKMLPPALAGDAERLASFRQEALLLATLNHPNIATIHGFEEPEPGTLLLVLERVEGETLAERLERGALAYEDALQIGAQIAEALEVAHERGVIHRDLKPGNVMIGPRGLAKVLDFGLARAAGGGAPARPRGQSRPAPESAPKPLRGMPESTDATMEIPLPPAGSQAGDDRTVAASEGGVVVQGTPGYMSPEQILAGEQDARTDVFAFGALLYECLTGRKAFAAATPVEILRATLEQEPDWSLLPPRTAPAVRDTLARCLRKDPAERLEEIRAARLEIEEALGIRRAAALRAGEAAVTPTNLPQPLTTFVGRAREMETCGQLFARTRLLTLTGVGGSGKTRLALELASAALPDFPDGVWFVDLAPVTDPQRVEMTVASAMGVREEPGRPLAQALAERLANRRVLLVLDNCEHLIRAGAGLAVFLLAASAELKVLATSREPLAVAGEMVHAVPSLELPRPDEGGGAAGMAGYESVRLFVERARLVDASFELTDARAPAVGEICRCLDGIPLAIELAAARVRVLGVDEIRDKLSDRFRLLTGGSRSALPRQQTLRAAIQWSYDHLLPEEQEMLRRLAAFAGGWTLESATAVAGVAADEFEILDLVQRLVDKSLVVSERGDGRSRYRFLETVRAYALELLEQSPERDAVRDRHLAFFFDLALAAEQKLTGPEQGRWFLQLEEERENLLGALRRCLHDEAGAGRALRMAGSLARFWSARGHYGLGRRVLEDALARSPEAEPDPVRATALVRAGGLALYQGDFAAARPLIERSLAIYRALGDRKGIARALNGLATTFMYQGDFAIARAHFEEGLAIYREIGNQRGAALALHNLGYVYLAEGDLPRAQALYEEALVALRAVGDQATIALTLADLGTIHSRLGRRLEARAQLVEALETARALGARREAAYALEGSAELAMAAGDPERAARLLGAAQGVRETVGTPLVPSEQKDREALGARAGASLGEERLREAMEAGRGWGAEDAVAHALEWLHGVDPEARV